MNVRRGLFRAWVLISVLWIIGAGSVAYLAISPDTVSGNYAVVLAIKEDAWKGTPESIDWKKPFYELVVSPSAQRSAVLFDTVGWQYLADWKKTRRPQTRQLPRWQHSVC
jgi:hypothetical protein